MITQDFIYKAAQRAFGEHHPKFPWPKKHDLDDQSDQFKRAFLEFSADINAEHESFVKDREERLGNVADVWKEKAFERFDTIEKVRNQLYSAQAMAFVAWCAVAILVAAIVIMKLNS